MTENEKFIYDRIIDQVKMGFLSISEIEEQIIEEIEDNEFEDEISEDWAIKKIKSAYKERVERSALWKQPTATDRLINAFKELCKANIIALHNAGYTTSDGEQEVIEVERELRDRGVISDGYCFYHEQDLERAVTIEHPSLYIAFQKIDNSDPEVATQVGRKVVDVLMSNGLEVDWSGDPKDKILLPKFEWQRLYSTSAEDLLDYEEVVELMTKR